MKYLLSLFAALATMAQAQQPPPPPEHGNPAPHPAHQLQPPARRPNAHAPVRPNVDLAARVDALQRQLNELRAEVRRLRAQSPTRPQPPLLDARRSALRKAMEARRHAFQPGRPTPEARLRELRSRMEKSHGQPQLKKKPAKPAETEKLRREKLKEKSKAAGEPHADHSGKHKQKEEKTKEKEQKEEKHEKKDKDGSDDDNKDREDKDDDKEEA